MDSSLLGVAWRSHIGDQQISIPNTSETTIVPGLSGAFADVYLLAIMNRSPSTDTDVTIRDGVGGTVRWKGTVQAGLQAGFALPPNGALKQSAIGNAWTAQCSVGVSTVEITVAFVKIPER